MTVWTEERDGLDVELSRASFELAQARVRLEDAVVRAGDAGASQRAIAEAMGAHQVAVHRILARRRSQPALPGEDAVGYERPEARFHYELHREIARQVLTGDWSVEQARARLDRMRTTLPGAGARRWLDEWESLLSMPTDDLVTEMLRADEHGDDLRQVSPLSGVVSPEQRAAALNRAYRR